MKSLDYILLGIILICVIIALRVIIKRKGACCGACSDCPKKCLKKEKSNSH